MNSDNTTESKQLNFERGESREPTPSQIDEVARLLSGESLEEPNDEKPGDAESGAAERESDKTPGKPTTLDELAERLSVNVSDLYNLQVPFGGGESPKTLGQIKDLVSDIDAFEMERLTWSETRAKKEADFMRSAQELTEVLQLIPKNAISKELLQRVSERRTAAKQREDMLLRDAIPDWADEQTETRERQLMQAHLKDYGFPEGYLDNLIDHKTVKFIRDAALRKQRIDNALERVRTVKKPGQKPSERPAVSKAESRRQARRVRSHNQIAQIVDLINNG